MRNTNLLKQTLPEPERPEFLPKKAQWLAGEGAGSWFFIEKISKDFEITRFSPKGKIECEGLFKIINSNEILDLDKSYHFVHLSHCAFVHIKQGKRVFKLMRTIHHKSTVNTDNL